MIRIALCIWFACATQALAAPVQVKAGEHNGFTRIVIDYGKAVQWQVGRTEDGYELRIDGDQPEYDFSESFKIIGTSRLVSLWADPAIGAMRIGVACPCHAIPFEFREGIIVIDLRNGPPPKGSSFEDPLPALPAESPKPAAPIPLPPQDQASAYDWQQSVIAELSGRQVTPAPQPIPPETKQERALDRLRETLISQISEGASQGLIEIAPLKLPKPETPPPSATEKPVSKAVELPPEDPSDETDPSFSALRLGLGELPALSIHTGAPEHHNLGAKGETCLESDVLDVAAWRGDAPVADEMQRTNQNIIGEFDKIDPEALKTAIQFYLSVGFGAEAKQLMKAFPDALPQRPMWQAMADLVDGAAESHDFFRGQMGCDGAAALWAVLENNQIAKGDFVNRDAIYLAFSDLPIELRRALGPRLIDRFLAIGDEASVTKLRAVILRGPGEAGPEVTLMDAAIDMHGNQPAAAEAKLQSMIGEPGPSSGDALVALIEAKVAQNLSVEKELVDILEAMVQERDETAQAAPTQRALALAQAASGNFLQAFKAAETQPDLEQTIWRLLSRLGTDDAVLTHAVLASDRTPPKVDRETSLRLVTRLYELGLPEAARRWVQDDAGIDPLLLAKIDLARADATEALRLLAGQDSPDALAVRATALQILGENTEAAKAFTESGDATSALQATTRAQDWQALRQTGSGNWQALAEAATKAEALNALQSAPLAYGSETLAQTAATRDAVQALLAQVPPP